jgi:O-acetylserine/cysteine efflux transporter
MSTVVPLPMLALSLLVEGPHRDWHSLRTLGEGNGPRACLALLYIVVAATVVGSGLWTVLMSRHPAGVVAPFSMLVPVAGIGSSWLLLGETTDRVELAFGALVVGGVLAGARGARDRGRSGAVVALQLDAVGVAEDDQPAVR